MSSQLDQDIRALVDQTTAALMAVLQPPATVAKEERTLEKLAKPSKRVSGDAGKKVDKAILISLNVRKKTGLSAAELLPLMPPGTTKLVLSYRLRLLRAAGSIRREGGRKQARYLRVYAKG